MPSLIVLFSPFSFVLQLEQERCDLLEELQSVRDKLSLAEKELEQKNDQLKQLSTNYDKQTKALNEQITEVGLLFSPTALIIAT